MARTLTEGERIQKAVDAALQKHGLVLLESEFRELAKCSPTTAQRWRNGNIGPTPVKLGRQWRYPTEETVRWLLGGSLLERG